MQPLLADGTGWEQSCSPQGKDNLLSVWAANPADRKTLGMQPRLLGSLQGKGAVAPRNDFIPLARGCDAGLTVKKFPLKLDFLIH